MLENEDLIIEIELKLGVDDCPRFLGSTKILSSEWIPIGPLSIVRVIGIIKPALQVWIVISSEARSHPRYLART